MYVKIEGLDGTCMRETLRGYLHRLLGIVLLLLLDLGQIVQILTHHGCHQLHSGQIRYRILAYIFTVPQHRDPVAYCIYLLQEMCDEHYADSLIPQSPHQSEELLHLFIIQR